MNDSQTNPKHLVDEHLDAVEAVLSQGGMNRPERRRIIDEIEVQVHEMLAIYGENPCVADVQSVLAKLDPPEAYAAAGEPAVASMPEKTSAPDSEPKYSKLAIVGAMWIAMFSLIFLIAAQGSSVLIRNIIMIIVFTAPFGATTLGWIAVSQIRHSQGRLYGMGLALFDGLFFPLAAISVAIFIGFCRFVTLLIFNVHALKVEYGDTFTYGASFWVTIPLTILISYFLDRKIIRKCLEFSKKPV